MLKHGMHGSVPDCLFHFFCFVVGPERRVYIVDRLPFSICNRMRKEEDQGRGGVKEDPSVKDGRHFG